MNIVTISNYVPVFVKISLSIIDKNFKYSKSLIRNFITKAYNFVIILIFCKVIKFTLRDKSLNIMQLMVLMKQENVDVRLPCGMTPLMVAAVKGGGLDTGEEEEEDGTAAVIADLVAQGAELNATMDKTGETSLHLAARYIH